MSTIKLRLLVRPPVPVSTAIRSIRFMEPGTGLALLGTAIGSAKLVERILGPTANYLGGRVEECTRKGIENLGRIFLSAVKRLGNTVNKPGAVPPKVLKEIIDHGSFCEDELNAEYFGGVLASSRSVVDRDDRGAMFVSILGKMSSYQIRGHYILYKIFRAIYKGKDVNLGTEVNRLECGVFVPETVFNGAMDFSEGENQSVLIPHILGGLERELLISDEWVQGTPGSISDHYGFIVKGPGLIYSTSLVGLELFNWAHGLGGLSSSAILDPKVVFEVSFGLQIDEDSKPINIHKRNSNS